MAVAFVGTEVTVHTPVGLEFVEVRSTQPGVATIEVTHRERGNFKPHDSRFADGVDLVVLAVDVQNEFLTVEAQLRVASIKRKVLKTLLRGHDVEILPTLFRVHQDRVGFFTAEGGDVIKQTLEEV